MSTACQFHRSWRSHETAKRFVVSYLVVSWSWFRSLGCLLRSNHMKATRVLYSSAVAFGFALLLAGSQTQTTAGQAADAVRIDTDDLGGVVTSSKGPEAGVWVIAETTDLPTKFVKIVVTDDRGRYLVPDLPKANYNVWVRGYGLV